MLRKTPLPIGTFVFVVVALMVSFGPAAQVSNDLLAYRRDAVETGGLHRLWTGQLFHGSARLALWDLSAVMLLGAWLERSSRARFAATIGASGFFAGTAVFVLRPDIYFFDGSSAIASGLYVAVSMCIFLEERSSAVRTLAMAALLGFTLKIALELAGRWPSPVASTLGGFVVLPAAHGAGALGGLLSLCLPHSRQE